MQEIKQESLTAGKTKKKSGTKNKSCIRAHAAKRVVKPNRKRMTLNAFITGVKHGQVHRKITLLHRAAFNTTAKESLSSMGYSYITSRTKK